MSGPAAPPSSATPTAVSAGAGRHYLDHASTTPLRPEARAAMEAWSSRGVTADPGRVHTEGRMAREAVEQAREQVAGLLGCRPREVVFTSGGTEAVVTAVWGAVRAASGPVLVAGVEHSAVRESSERAAPVAEVAVDQAGRISVAAVLDAVGRARAAYGADPALVHCQWANHEVGTVHPVAEVVAACAAEGLRCHVDAVAIAGHLPVDVGGTGADLVSVSSHKLGGPAGVGALVVRRGVRLDPLLVGGAQERARRAGLEPVTALVGFGAAAETLAAPGRLDEEAVRAAEQTDRLAAAALAVDGVRRLGDPVERLPHLACVSVDGVEAEPVLLALDQAGVAVHSGSACSSETLEPSPVLQAMGVDADHSLRVSVGWSTTDDDIGAFTEAFPRVVAALRGLRG